MEHTHTDNDELSILRDRLVEADTLATIAGDGFYTERREAQSLLLTHPDSGLQSLSGINHISSGAIDDAITMILRPQLPVGTIALLSSDAMTIWDVTNNRQRTRLSKVVTSHTTTLIPTHTTQR
jgi:hypothetical protein